ncbi:ORF6C domain-containing protein [Fusobacterium nucleatum]|uniref:ORF6C domain-containing protein n=1 Tax=Fusobacterium nucleatum TaxID=851 RepID=UPI0030CAB1F2
MNELRNKETITSKELLEQVNFFREKEYEFKAKNGTLTEAEKKRGKFVELEHKDLLKVIRDEFEEEIDVGKISPMSYKDTYSREQTMFILTLKQAKQVLLRESKFVRKAIIEYIEKLEEQFENPFKNLSFQQMMIMTLQEQEKIADRVDIIESKVDNEIRVDNGEQRKIQKAVGTRIYQRIDIIPQLAENKKFVFQALYRDLKDRFEVASYRDIKRKDLTDCLEYISTWIEPADLRIVA